MPHDIDPPWQIHPWTADWYELQPYERANGKSIWRNLQRRRYGGDLQGILDRLDYLHDLGVGGLYLTPVFQAPSSHKYDGATYHHVDPTFCPDPDGDRRLMAAETPDGPATWVWTAADRLLLRLIDDVAFCVGHPFWRAWRRHVKAINLQAYVTGELFGTLEALAGYLQGDEFDACMNYPWAYACAEYFIQEGQRIATAAFDHDLFALYKRLIHLRNSTPALQRGDFTTVLADDDQDVYVFQRSHGAQRVLVALNRSQAPQAVSLPAGQAGRWRDLLSNELCDAAGDVLRVALAPQWGRVLLAV